MSGGHKRILSPFTVHIKQKAWNKTREKYMPEQPGDHITIKRNGSKNSETIKVHFTIVVKKMIVVMMMRTIMENIEAVAHRCCSK